MAEACRGDVTRPHAGRPRWPRERPSAGGVVGGAVTARPAGVLGHWPTSGAKGGPPSRRRRTAAWRGCVKPSSPVRQPVQSEPAGARCRRWRSGARVGDGAPGAAAGPPAGGGGGVRWRAGRSGAAAVTEGPEEGERTRPPMGAEVGGGPGGVRRAAGGGASGEVHTRGRESGRPGRGEPTRGGAPMGMPERRACVLRAGEGRWRRPCERGGPHEAMVPNPRVRRKRGRTCEPNSCGERESKVGTGSGEGERAYAAHTRQAAGPTEGSGEPTQSVEGGRRVAEHIAEEGAQDDMAMYLSGFQCE